MAGYMDSKASEDVYQVKTFGLAAMDSSGVFSPFNFSRRATSEHDVQFKVLYCGTCNYDRNMSKNKFGLTTYPFVLGHEAVGVVTEIGTKVQKFKLGDKVGVGGVVGTCGECEMCTSEQEQYCPKALATDGFMGSGEYGACSDIMVTNENFLVLWPENLPMDSGVPLMCGVTSYSPLRHHGLDKPGMRVGIVGLGGLGHLAVRFAKAFGAKVTVISSSPKKKKDAFEELGADYFLVSSNPKEIQAAAGTLDGIIDTVPVVHALEPLLALLKPFGKLITVCAVDMPVQLHLSALLQGGKSIVGSSHASIKDTQEMLYFAAKHNIVADVEIISSNYINTAMERIENSDVKYRFVIDVGNTLKSA